MILIGTMNLTRTVSHGDFYCPTCGMLRDYRLRSRRPFLTLYFIPVIPIGPAEQFVQCTSCKTNSPLSALEVDEKSFRESQWQRCRHEAFQSAVMVVTADGVISEAEIDALITIGNQLLPDGMDREELGAICSSIRLNRIKPQNYIATVCRHWTTDQRRLVLQACFLAASAEGELQPKSLSLLAWLREQFGMTEREYEAAIEEAIESGLPLPPASPQLESTEGQ